MENNGHFSQLVIDNEVHIAWLEVHSGAELTITAAGKLTVDGSYTYSEGISLYGGFLHSDGKIIFKDIEIEFIANLAPVCLSQKTTYYSELHDYEFCVEASDFDR